MLHFWYHSGEILLVTVSGKAVIHRRAAETIPVRDLNQWHPRLIKSTRYGDHLIN